MNPKYIVHASLLAALMGGAGLAVAQNSAMPAAPDPALGGQASTQSSTGTPNPTQRPDMMAPGNSRESVKAEARVQNRNNANTLVPKGEASTTVNHQPNAMPRPTGEMTRAEVSQNARKVKPQFGEKGERPDLVTNPTEKTGTPK